MRRGFLSQKKVFEIVADDLPYGEKYFDKGELSNWHVPYTWENFELIFRKWATFIAEGFPTARKVLDVGCARGFLIKALLDVKRLNPEFCYEVDGIDISEYAYRTAVEEAKPYISVCRLKEFAPAKEYDLIVCLDVFEHCDDEEITTFLNRIHPFCKEALLVSTPYPGDPRDKDATHINIKSTEEWRSLFANCGFGYPYGMEREELGRNHPWIKSLRTNLFIFEPLRG